MTELQSPEDKTRAEQYKASLEQNKEGNNEDQAESGICSHTRCGNKRKEKEKLKEMVDRTLLRSLDKFLEKILGLCDQQLSPDNPQVKQCL